ncbi:glycosyltransferase family 2 protein [Periconia macrospinosa]|uniref:Glycosyltransferase family 2 protein n=1 Tax=Periconia macrospinosa TaxID=97972 RepID=A0A2V1DRS3_9PLEO|nr:glycosyltransferase family 2 protein [Periconia macrospinosa]
MLNYLIAFLTTFLFRYNWFVVHAWVRHSVRPIPLKNPPRHAHEDVTVVIPTICTDGELPLFEKVLRSLANARPHSIIVVTPHPRSERIQMLAANVGGNIRVIGSDKKSKRHQVCLGIREVKTDFTILADDDVWWPGGERAIPAFLAPFENPDTVAAGTCQAVERKNWINIAEFLGCLYIARRNGEFVPTSAIDGGHSCLSGRTMIIRTQVLQDQEFKKAYLGETCLGRQLNPDDDNCITRYLYRRGRIEI